MAKALAFLVLLIISPAVYAADHTVGGNSGWTDGIDYDNWANGQSFVVGDILVFNFDVPNHAVDEVNQTAYTNCNTNRPISSSASSPTRITLSAAGTRYFICPNSNHCAGQNQKLAVTVTAGSTTPGGAPPPTNNGTTPSPPSGTPETPETTPGTSGTPSTTPPPSGSAANILGCRSRLIVGFSLVLAALLELMG